jgi:hypothetical protein
MGRPGSGRPPDTDPTAGAPPAPVLDGVAVVPTAGAEPGLLDPVGRDVPAPRLSCTTGAVGGGGGDTVPGLAAGRGAALSEGSARPSTDMARSGASSVRASEGPADKPSGCAAVSDVGVAGARWTAVDADGPG